MPAIMGSEQIGKISGARRPVAFTQCPDRLLQHPGLGQGFDGLDTAQRMHRSMRWRRGAHERHSLARQHVL
ncbi:hypothetical protein D3C73_1245160 [compost metagenome]